MVGTPATTVALITQWQGTVTLELYDQTALGDIWTSNVAGFRKLAGTIDGSWDVTSDTGQTLLHNAIMNATTLALDLYVDSVNGHGYSCIAYLSQFQTTTPVAGLVKFTCNFENQGQVTFD